MWVLLAFTTSAPIDLTGTVCRLNRGTDRLIVQTEGGERLRVLIGSPTRVTFEKTDYRSEDLRPGDRVRVVGVMESDQVEADAIDVQLKVAEAILDALLGTKPPLIGRFAIREAKTEFFSFQLPGGDYIRVDAKSAYGPKGRVWVSTLRSGDLLELSGKFSSEELFVASGIRILTNEESSRCPDLSKTETKEQTTARRTAEQKFLEP